MENPMMIWYAIVGVLLMVFFVHFVRSVRDSRRHSLHSTHSGHHHLIEMGREKDMFYIPGDSDDDDDD